jgi:hypothetical protein
VRTFAALGLRAGVLALLAPQRAQAP